MPSTPRNRTVSRLQPFASTIFAEMTALATLHDAVNLGQGFPDTDGPAAMLEVARRAIAEGVNQYPPGPGMPVLRQAIAEDRRIRYGLDSDPDSEVLVTVGATEAISAAILGLVEPGEEVVLIEPYYDSYAASVALAGAVRRTVPLVTAGDGFAVDLDALRGAITAKTKMLIVNSPHNPTGTVFTDHELRAIAELACERDLIVLSDEVYEHLVFDGLTHTPMASLPGMRERTVTVSSAAKTFNVTGWKTGWAIGPRELIDGVRAAKQFMSFVGGAPFQPAVAYALTNEQPWVVELRQSLQGKRDVLDKALTEAGFTVHSGGGTYFLLADIRPLGETDAGDFCRALPERIGVAAVPGRRVRGQPRRLEAPGALRLLQAGPHSVRSCTPSPPAPRSSAPMTARTIPTAFVHRYLAFSPDNDVDLSGALRAAGIDLETLSDPRARLTPTQVTTFIQSTWQITDDELFGLGSAPVPRGTFRLICLTLIHCPDLGSAFARMSDVIRALPALAPLSIEKGEESTRVSFAVRAREGVAEPDVAERVTTDFVLILLHRFSAWLIGKRVRTSGGRVSVLGTGCTVGAGLRLHLRSAGHLRRGSARHWNSTTRPCVHRSSKPRRRWRSTSENLRFSSCPNVITTALRRRRCDGSLELGVKGRTSTAEEIAEMLSFSVPHLRRLLRRDGTSLNQLREEVLRDVAIAGLRRGESVEVLSARLGFSEPSAFRRAFKRWTGDTPSSYR